MRWIVLALTLTPGLALGDIYRWVDGNGAVHYSDTPGLSTAEPVQLHTVAPAKPRTETAAAPALTDREAADRLCRDRLAREAKASLAAERDPAPSRDCTKARNKLALTKAQWERKSRRGYRQSDKIKFENLIADWQLRAQQSCN
ncbi:DUF4124 domain-containing protein [Hydrocarboniclastica marina]|nr:DUF4124 domain-containing protein [Hydrocarboniclastica marina]